MFQSNLSVPKVPRPDRGTPYAHAKNGPKPGEHVKIFRMKWDDNKVFHFENC